MIVAIFILMHLIPANVTTFQLITPEGISTLTRIDGGAWKSSGGNFDKSTLKVVGNEIVQTVQGKREDGFTGGSFGPGPEWGFTADTKWDKLTVVKVPADPAMNLEAETMIITKGTNWVTVAYQEGTNCSEKCMATWGNAKNYGANKPFEATR